MKKLRFFGLPVLAALAAALVLGMVLTGCANATSSGGGGGGGGGGSTIEQLSASATYAQAVAKLDELIAATAGSDNATLQGINTSAVNGKTSISAAESVWGTYGSDAITQINALVDAYNAEVAGDSGDGGDGGGGSGSITTLSLSATHTQAMDKLDELISVTADSSNATLQEINSGAATLKSTYSSSTYSSYWSTIGPSIVPTINYMVEAYNAEL
ncbi:hypothetical protein AGMMS49940_02350 [Spirochaetia bacterium]|nr:hypothetical protein AGMMS49940_02350 [Spirochaetia bacterium]